VNVALSPEHNVVGLTATLAVGNGKTVKVILLVCGFTQLGVPELSTLTIVMVVLVVYVPVL
jgi:hypothetical protein